MRRAIVRSLNVLLIRGLVALGSVCSNASAFSGLSFEKITCNKGPTEETVLHNWSKVWF